MTGDSAPFWPYAAGAVLFVLGFLALPLALWAFHNLASRRINDAVDDALDPGDQQIRLAIAEVEQAQRRRQVNVPLQGRF